MKGIMIPMAVKSIRMNTTGKKIVPCTVFYLNITNCRINITKRMMNASLGSV